MSWREISSRWDKTIERAEQLPEETLHVSVNSEFSFVEMLRHLVFATDKWFTAPILGGEYDPIGLPNTGSLDFPWPGLDRDADPSFAEALAVRRNRGVRFSKYLEVLQQGNTHPVPRGARERNRAICRLLAHGLRRGARPPRLRDA